MSQITATGLTAALLLTLALLAPVSARAKVKVFPAKGKDVRVYKTYQWNPIRVVTKQGFLEDDAEVAPLIRQSVNQQLATRGYVEVAEGGELIVNCAGLSVASSQLEGFLMSWGWDIYWGYGVSTVSPVTRVNHEGAILVSLIDAQTKKGVWFGYSTEALGRRSTLGSSIDKATSKLLKKLPKSKK